MQTKQNEPSSRFKNKFRDSVLRLKLFPGNSSGLMTRIKPFVYALLFITSYLILAFIVWKADLKWATDLLIWPTYIFPNSNLLSIVFELIYAYYVVQVIRLIIRKLFYIVRFLVMKDTWKRLMVWLERLPRNVFEMIKNIGRRIIALPQIALVVIKGIGSGILSIPGKTLRTIRHFPGFIAGELLSLGKEFLDMIKNFYRLRTSPGKRISLLLSLIIFLVCIKFYYNTSIERHKENSQDKLVPTGEQLWNGFRRTVFEVKIKAEYDANGEVIKNDLPLSFREALKSDKLAFANAKFGSKLKILKNGAIHEYLKHGESLLWQDTKASGSRILIAMIFIFAGIYAGLFMGAFPYAEKVLYRFVLFFDKIPALAVLPILFIVFGLGETAKIALIVIGVVPTVILDTYLKVKEVHDEQLVKGMTLDASQPEIVFRIIFPQIIPKVLDTVRLNFKAVILFLIAGEALAAEAGIGYRIFVVRRYMDMATIFPYVVWISILAFLVDMAFRIWISKHYQWLNK